MSSLDDKLRALVKDDTMGYEVDEKIARIKDVFESEGYIRQFDFMEKGGYLSLEESPVVKWLHDNGWHSPDEFAGLQNTLTNNYGRMFFDKFKAELDKEKPFDATNEHESQLVLKAIGKCEDAARRAAGLPTEGEAE
jgi:hypothetical protein